MESAMIVLVVAALLGVEWLLLQAMKGMDEDHQTLPRAGDEEAGTKDDLDAAALVGGLDTWAWPDLPDIGGAG